MNVENINLLADVIEGKVEPPICLSRQPFHMDSWIHCICGYARSLESDDEFFELTARDKIRAMEWLGIDDRQANMLFAPWFDSEDLNWVRHSSREEAAATLRRLAETGDVIWHQTLKLEWPYPDGQANEVVK